MDPVRAFLTVTAMSYWMATVHRYRYIASPMPLIVEKMIMLVLANVLTLNLLISNQVVWTIMTALWTMMAVANYAGLVKWNIAYKTTPSDAAQALMCVWDLATATACLTQI